ncbi:hypothetical protein ABIC71_001727 [Herbaspirillum seropedicae]|jgi:hypothetical protein|uniref:type II toxin-antitoxin system RelE/ParE family toxin n=1 Tax=Herbaspirillum seropedicae TaxID=964 RepID=UPI00339AA406
MAEILKRREFVRWQLRENLVDAQLCRAVQEMESGLIDAHLGGLLYKKRIARPGAGKRGGFRTLVSARIGSRYVFVHGFSKSDMDNISRDEVNALQFSGSVLLELHGEALVKAVLAGILFEVKCERYH